MKKIFLTTAILCFTAASSRADTVYLQNGRELHGQIIEHNGEYLEIKLGSGSMKISAEDVKSFEIEEPAEGYSKISLPELEGEGTEEAIGEGKEVKPVSNMILEAKYLNDKVSVIGKTDLPRGTPVKVYFKRRDDIIAMKETSIKGEGFYVVFGPFGIRTPAGKYSVEAQAELRDKRTASGSADLVIGTTAQMSLDESEAIQYFSKTVDEVQSLYDGLNQAYAHNKQNFDKRIWDEWSADWLPKASDLRKALVDYSAVNVASLYPRSQNRLEACMNQLMLLHMAYSLDLAKKKNITKKNEGPSSIMLEPQFLKDSITEGLSETKKEILLAATE